jgi:alkanesulfonate monooxygenase SsuD/methylene tetrahydromethanopterin reductase-like flavin-dependent oxidoreductase (luciferase family)
MQEVRGSIPLSSTTMPVDHVDGLRIDIQINHGWIGFAEHVELALLAEEAGFDTLWVADHLSGRSMNAPSMPECFVTLGGLAASTSRIGLGSLVANAQVRHPAVLANAAATVHQMSGGRFTLGIGAGASPNSSFAHELLAAGLTVAPSLEERHRALVEQVEMIKGIWSKGRDERFDGFPFPTPRPRIIVGVNSPALARLAIDHADGLNVRASHPRVEEILEIAAGRIECSVWVPFDAELFEGGFARIREWSARGVQRVVAVLTGKPDKSLIRNLV